MDPLTAVSLATSVITFIDFSWSLVRGTYEVFESSTGRTKENAHITNVIDDLQLVTKDLDVDFRGRNKHEKALILLAKQCHGLSIDLHKILSNLKTKDDSRWESLKVKWQSMRKEKEVASVERRLLEYRSQMTVRLQMLLW